MFQLAGHLKMTVGELEVRMDSAELSEWVAYTRYYEPIGDAWLQTGYVAAAVLAPHSKKKIDPRDFVPIAGKAPMHRQQIDEELKKMLHDFPTE